MGTYTSYNGVARAIAFVSLSAILCLSPAFAQRPADRKMPQRNRRVSFAPNRYIVFLAGPPVADRFGSRLNSTEAVNYRRELESKSQSVRQQLSARRILVTGAVSTTLNAIFVAVSADRIPEVRAIPGVIGVMPERKGQRTLNRATQLVNAPAAWATPAVGGKSNAGAGIKIGIIDSGIDQTSPAFNDAGLTLPPDFPKCNVQSDCDRFTNKKVIVARSYVPMMGAGSDGTNPAADSSPDDFSARDHVGHGSAVAAVAAGVQTDGALSFSGMAPRAYLGSYKVYGSPGVNDYPGESVYIKALDDALNDGMDVVNFSSGLPSLSGPLDDVQCGNPAGVACDPLAKAFQNAALSGLIVVVSAGNNGPMYTSIASPAAAPAVIGVGASVNSHSMLPTVSLAAAGAPSNLTNLAAALADTYFTPSTEGANTGALIDVAQLDGNGQACSALPAGALAHSYVLVQQGNCDFDTQAYNAQAAGAIGIVFYMADSSAIVGPTGICWESVQYSCDFYGPGVMISLSDGQNLKQYIDAHPGAPVTIDAAGAEQLDSSVVDSLAIYSSIGPAVDGSIKPDLVAPGGFDPTLGNLPSSSHGMYTVGESYDPKGELFTSNGFLGTDGTSFSSPMVAGAAALVKQAHPAWTVAQIKSAVVNNTVASVTHDDYGFLVDVQSVGGGRLDANAAVTATVTAVPATLSFGYLASGASTPAAIPVTLTNTGGGAVALNAAVYPGSRTTNAAVKVDQKSITIAKGASAILNVSLSVTAPVAGEYSGVVWLTSANPAISLRIPYLLLIGDASYPSVVPLFESEMLGVVGHDVGALPVQVVDSWGVPVAGAPVTFTISPHGGVSLKSVTGTPADSIMQVSFVPQPCTPASSTVMVTCSTDNYGIAWVDVVGGPNPRDLYTRPVTIEISALQQYYVVYVGLLAQPTLGNVTDAAAYGSTIAPGSYVSLFGASLMYADMLTNSAGDSADTTTGSGRLPMVLDDVNVSFDAPASGSLPAISVPGYLYYTSTGQVNVWAPWELEDYPSAQMKVTFSEQIRSNVVTVPLRDYVPAFLMYASGPVFIADAVDPVNCRPPYIIGSTCPAIAGALVQFYVNGLGPVTNQPASGDPAPSSPLAQTTTMPVVKIGGKQATVQFAGLAPGFVGLYQVNAYIPSGLATGNQPISISIGGQTSPDSIASGASSYAIVLPVK